MNDAPAPDDDLAQWPGDAPWQALPPSALGAFRLGSSIGFGIVGLVVGPAWWQLALGLGAPVAFLALGFWQAGLAYRYTRWQLDDDGLRVRRGRFWRSEVLVPRARVQHLDIERGPVERRFGLATLVVHTAGTRMNAVRQPGFDEASASRLRDALVPRQREHDDAPHG
jgi:uncharacterized protein